MDTKTTRPFIHSLIHNQSANSHLHLVNLVSDKLMLMLESAFKHQDVGMIIAHKQLSTSQKAIETLVACSKTYQRDMIVLDIENILTGNAAYQVVRYNPLRGKSLLQAVRIVCSVFTETEVNENDKLNIIRTVCPLLEQQIGETKPHLTLRKLQNETIRLSETSLNPTSKLAIDGLLKAFSILEHYDLIDRLTDDINEQSFFNFADIILNNKIGVIKNSDINRVMRLIPLQKLKSLQALATADLVETLSDIIFQDDYKHINRSFRRYFFADLTTLFNPEGMPLIMRYGRKLNMQSHVFLNYQELPLSPDGSQEKAIVNCAHNRIYEALSGNLPIYAASEIGQRAYITSMLDANTIYGQKLPLDTVLLCCNQIPSAKLLPFKDFYGVA